MKICVTGMGVMCASGSNVAHVMAELTANRSAIKAMPAEEQYGLTAMAVAVCPAIDEIPGVPRHLLRGVDRVSLFSLWATHEALNQAEKSSALKRQDVPVVWGSSMGGISTLNQGYEDLLIHRKRRVRPTTVPYAMPSAAAFHLAHHLGLRGAAATVSVACASSALAIAQGARLIGNGEADVVVVGGCDSMLSSPVRRAWQMSQAVCGVDEQEPHASCRPFSARRSGFAMGEGAACLVLESQAHAAARGATVLGWLRGTGHTTDALHIARSDPAAQVHAMRLALNQAALQPQDISYVNAQGTATVTGDMTEAMALLEVFGRTHPGVPVSSTKALHGHLIGGAGALEAVITLEALRLGVLPGNPHSPDVDSAFADLNIFQHAMKVTHAAPRLAMSNSFAFGGVNAVLVLEGAIEPGGY